jgi:hypothetical protein
MQDICGELVDVTHSPEEPAHSTSPKPSDFEYQCLLWQNNFTHFTLHKEIFPSTSQQISHLQSLITTLSHKSLHLPEVNTELVSVPHDSQQNTCFEKFMVTAETEVFCILKLKTSTPRNQVLKTYVSPIQTQAPNNGI